MANKTYQLQNTMKSLKFGMEIEMGGKTRQHAANTAQEFLGGSVNYVGGSYDTWTVTDPQGRTWSFVRDSSLSDFSYSEQVELVTPILTWNDIPVLQELVRRLRKSGLKASTNGGVHCHVGAEQHTINELRNLAKIFNRLQGLAFDAVQVQQKRRNTYCKPNEESFVNALDGRRFNSEADLNRAWYGSYNHNAGQRYDSSRYHALNMNAFWNKRTVEFRFGELHDLHAGKLKAFLHLCLGFMAQAKHTKATTKRTKAHDGNKKYAMRVALLAMGMIGDEFKSTRQHLLDHLPGNNAWKNAEVA